MFTTVETRRVYSYSNDASGLRTSLLLLLVSVGGTWSGGRTGVPVGPECSMNGSLLYRYVSCTDDTGPPKGSRGKNRAP